ncbi:MAG: hypothetical protein DMG97_25195 [Acidobacteria bacterium]|nr:MAG: hypothetical protein DMG97_25195 [Acidobacteriota bacterium]
MEAALEIPPPHRALAPHSPERAKEQMPRRIMELHPMPVQAAQETATAALVACREFLFPAATTW